MVSLVVAILIAAFASSVFFFLGVFSSDKMQPLIDGLLQSRLAEYPGFKAVLGRVRSLCSRKGADSPNADSKQLVGSYSELVSSPLRHAKLVSDGNPDPLHHTGRDSEDDAGKPDLDAFNCRVIVTQGQQENADSDMLEVEVCGTVNVPDDCGEIELNITIDDITDGSDHSDPVCARHGQSRSGQCAAFCYTTSLGRLSVGSTTLSEWIVVARLRCDRLWLPRKGKRLLQFNCTVASSQEGWELAHAEGTCTYNSPSTGYLDFEQNCQRAINLGVGLAFAVSASDSKLFSCEIDLIKDWARNHVSLADQSERQHRELEKQLDKTVAFFRRGNRLSIQDVCREMVEIAPMAERYDILDLCLRVAQAKGMAASEELDVIRKISTWLKVDPDRFRSMMEKILPVGIHEVQDTAAVLGITEDLSEEQIRQHLTREYGKWNSRVTNPDPEVRRQADQMLKLIAEVREKLAKQQVPA